MRQLITLILFVILSNTVVMASNQNCNEYKNALDRIESIALRQANISAAMAGQWGTSISESEKESIKYNTLSTFSTQIEKAQTLYNNCKLINTNIEVENNQQNQIDNQELQKNSKCVNAHVELGKVYNETNSHLTALENNDSIQYNLRELKKYNKDFSKYLNIANSIEWCLETYTYYEWYSYNKWIEYEFSNKPDLAIIEYKKSLNYTKKELWDKYLNDKIYINTVNRINNISINSNIVWLCWIKSYLNQTWDCKCIENHEWKYPSIENNYECKLINESQESIKDIQNNSENIKQCWLNEYYNIPSKDDILYDLWPSCDCKKWYNKIPGTNDCTLESKYIPTKKDELIIESINKNITNIYNNTPSEVLELIPRIEKILQKFDKNSRQYYIFYALYSKITLLEMGINF